MQYLLSDLSFDKVLKSSKILDKSYNFKLNLFSFITFIRHYLHLRVGNLYQNIGV